MADQPGGVPRTSDDTGGAGARERGEQGMDIRVRMHRAPKTLITGNGAIAKIGEEAKKLRATKVLIITDPGVACTGSVESGRGDRCTTPASRRGCSTRPSPSRRWAASTAS